MIPSKIDTCDVCKLYFRDVLAYACGGAAVFGMLFTISLFPFNVGERRNMQRNVIVNEEPGESTPLLPGATA